MLELICKPVFIIRENIVNPEINSTEKELLEGIKGFMPPDEGKLLFELAQHFGKKGPVLEIGSYCGKSAVYLGRGCIASGSVLFSLDHHNGSEEQQPGQEYFDPELYDNKRGKVDTLPHFRETIEKANLTKTVIAIAADSETVARFWKTPLSLIFIDGSHAYESVKKDYLHWAPHIMRGGALAFHDIFENPEEGGQAPFLVYSEALSSDEFEFYQRTGSLRVLKKK